MGFPTITVYGDSSNRSQMRLLNDNIPVDLRLVTRMSLELDTRGEVSSDTSKGIFDWWSGPKGVLRLNLGREWWPTGIFYSKLIVYDEVNARGVYWGTFRIRALENTQPN
jgi:hypothetical protein